MNSDSANKAKVGVRDDSDDLHVFAYVAFQDRFKDCELTSRWQKLEDSTYSSIISEPDANKYKPFQKFFEDAGVLVAETVHEYFHRLLDIAIAHPENLGNISPLEWTKSRILKDVCDFLGMDENVDENFEWTSTPRDESRVLRSAERLTHIAWREHQCPPDFLLPQWTRPRHPALALKSQEERSAYDSRFMAERMSCPETIQWVKYTEFLLGRKIALQIKNDALNSCIEAGAPGKSVNLILEAFTPEMSRRSSPTDQDTQELADRIAAWNEDLRRISRVATGKNRYSEADARKDLPELSLWQVIDNARVSAERRKNSFENPCQSFGNRTTRFDFIGELIGKSGFTAYDVYKRRSNRTKRPSKRSTLTS